MTDLSTRYLGLKLKNPLVVSASPLCREIANLKKMEECGASAVVLHSLFEEQILEESEQLDRNLWSSSDTSAEAQGYYPDFANFGIGPEEYLRHIEKAKKAVKIPVIASLNGVSAGGWVDYAKKMEQAGADALELNVYFVPTDTTKSGAEVEKMYLELVRSVTASVRIPVAVKTGMEFSSFGHFAMQLVSSGAKGVVLFNRFYQPDFDLEKLEVTPHLVLSRPAELLRRLHWAAILHGKLNADIALTGGVHSAEDVVKSMMAGAQVTMMTSALLQHGIEHLKTIEKDLQNWLTRNEYESVEQMRGSMSQKNVRHPAAFERANYMKVLNSWTG